MLDAGASARRPVALSNEPERARGSRILDAPGPLFSSKRERRFWAYTLAVVVALYSTLGLATTLAIALGDSVLGVVLFITGCLLVLAAVVTQGLTSRPNGAEIAVGLGIAAAYLMVFVRMSIPTERSHLVEYGVVAIFIYEALKERASQGRRVPVPALFAVLAASLVGVLDECIQAVLPSRVFDPVDIFFNVMASVMAVVASATLSWARRWGSRSRRAPPAAPDPAPRLE